MLDPKIYNLLNLNPRKKEEREKFNDNSAIYEFRRNPRAAMVQCNFDFIDVGAVRWTCYPLHMAVSLGASPDLIEVLYRAFPPAIEEKCTFDIGCTAPSHGGGCTPLHLASMYGASAEVVALLLDWCPPDAVMEKKGCGDTPLHIACKKNSRNTPSVEVISLFLEKCPHAAKDKNFFGCLPLHIACQHSRQIPKSLEIVSMLLGAQPSSVREKNAGGNTPLHYACECGAPLEVVSLLLEKCPVVAREKNREGQTPLHIACNMAGGSYDVVKILLEYNPNAIAEKDLHGETPYDVLQYEISPLTDEMAIIIPCVRELVLKEITDDIAENILNEFIRIEWWGGVKQVFDYHPNILQHLDVHLNVIPFVLSMIGRRCKQETMWECIRNSQDLLSDF
mmetsp:Transcript_7832/g.10716  ORF Transcript_7832/g.10716 Transcript_7832/m.10716 type:complete len:393 (-) Transcript_7832:29-1207(-)